MRLLLAEDDPELARQLKVWLREAGHEVTSTDNGLKALELGHITTLDAIILDIGLPDMDGFQVIERLRGDAIRTPVLCLTARDGVMDRVQGLQAGADDYATGGAASARHPRAHPRDHEERVEARSRAAAGARWRDHRGPPAP
jgi:two-component system, OmpR family, response regulator